MCKRLGTVFITILLFSASVAQGVSLDNVSFSIDFEDGFTPKIAKGEAQLQVKEGEPEIVTGRDGGKAIKLRNGLDALGFVIKGNLNPEHGAISFWLSSGGNWDGSMSNLLQILFYTNGGNDAQRMVLQTIWHHRGLSMISYNHGRLIGGFPLGANAPRAPLWMHQDQASILQKGQWYHYLYTWREGHMVVYQNGVKVAELSHPDLRFSNLGDRFFLGWHRDDKAKVTDMNKGILFFDMKCAARAVPCSEIPWESLIADFTVFNTYVFEHQAAEICKHGAVEYARQAVPSPVEMSTAYYQSSSTCVVDVIAPASTDAVGEILVKDSSGKIVKRDAFIVPGKLLQDKFKVDMSALPDGNYQVSVKLNTGFETPGRKFEKVNPEWLGNTLGADDVVLPPWTPVEVIALSDGKGYKVSVWGRDYMMRGALPASIISRGNELLNSPVDFQLDDKSVSWGAPQIREQSPTRVVLSSKAQAAGYNIEAITRIEYDGMLWTQLNFTAPQGRKLSSMGVTVPMVKKACVFAQYPTLRDLWFPKKESLFVGFDRSPYLFIGNDNVGIQWFAESDQWWHLKNPDRALEIAPTDRGGEIRVHMVDNPIMMPEEFSIAFGMMATPVRKRPKNWRGWGQQGRGAQENYNPIWIGYSRTSVAPGWLVPREVVKGYTMTLDRKSDMDGRRGALPFSSTLFLGPRHFQEPDLRHFFPEIRQFWDEWLAVPHVLRLGSKPGWNEIQVNPSRSYIDFYCWMFERMFANTEARGLYVDGYAGVRKSANIESGFGYIDRDGSVKPTWPIMSGRELYRRTSAIMLRHRGDQGAYIIHHATVMIMPVLSFVNAIYDGEFTGWGDIGEAVKKHGLPAGHSEDRIRAILSMNAFGHVPYIDSRNLYRLINHDVDVRFGGKRPEGYAASGRDMIARYLQSDVHAVQIPTAFLARELRIIMDDWGVAEPGVEFLPYWAENPAATISDNGRIGGYVNRNKGTALLIVIGGSGGSPSRTLDGVRGSNSSSEIVLDLNQFGFVPSGFRAFNAETRREYPVSGNQISLYRAPGELLFLQLDKANPATRPVAVMPKPLTAANLPIVPKSDMTPENVTWMAAGVENPTAPALYFTGAPFKKDSEPDGFRGIVWGEQIENLEDLDLVTTTEYGVSFYTRKNDNKRFEKVPVNAVYYGFYKGRFQSALLRDDIKRGTEPQKAFDDLKQAVFSRYGEGRPRNTYAWGEEYLWQGEKTEVYLGRDSNYGKVWLLINKRVK
ncbi:MAG: hypothetical protein JXR78_14250 [Victivallales bacterium]|nr:hypothetical protein [Victivallales bacterium]